MSGMPGRTVVLITPPATFTASGTSSPSSASRTDLATETPAFSCASAVDAPRCGVRLMLSRPSNGESVGGSFTKTSRAAPAMRFEDSAWKRASSSMIPPRLQLTMRNVGLASANCSVPIIPMVSGVFGMWMVMKSDCSITSFRLASCTPSCWARIGVTYGSKATSLTPKPASRWATRVPIRPSPMMPTVLSNSSVPVNFDRFHSPALAE